MARDLQGRFVLGPRLRELATAAGEDRLLEAADPVLARLRDITGESAQLYRRQGDSRVCVAGAERLTGLRDTVPVGATLTMKAGSAAQILLAWEEPDRLHRGLREARFTATALSAVRRRGWAQSVGEREPGVASVSAPVRGPGGRVVAAVSVSGPDRAADPPARPAARADRVRGRRQAQRGPPAGTPGRRGGPAAGGARPAGRRRRRQGRRPLGLRRGRRRPGRRRPTRPRLGQSWAMARRTSIRAARRAGSAAAATPAAPASARYTASWPNGTATSVSPCSRRTCTSPAAAATPAATPTTPPSSATWTDLVADAPPQLAAGEADRAEQPDLGGPLVHRHGQGVDDPEQRDDQGEAEQPGDQREDLVQLRLLVGRGLLGGPHLELGVVGQGGVHGGGGRRRVGAVGPADQGEPVQPLPNHRSWSARPMT